MHSIGLDVDVTQETHLMFYTFYIQATVEHAVRAVSKP